MKYVVIYERHYTTRHLSDTRGMDDQTHSRMKWEYFDDIKEAAEFATKKEGVLLKSVEYKVEEVDE